MNELECALSDTGPYQVLCYDELTTRPNRAEHVAATCLSSALPGNGGAVTGVFLPMIGISSNTVTLATRWRHEPPSSETVRADVLGARTRLFDVLARGQAACEANGIYTHRWFVTKPQEVEELTRSSVDAWAYSEADTAMRVIGFWRERGTRQDGAATILMIVYYPDLAAWDASRYWKPAPREAHQPSRNVWGEMFRKRRELLLDSWVTIHRLALPG